MKKLNTKLLSGTIASVLLVTTIGVPFVNVHAAEVESTTTNYVQNISTEVSLTQEDFYKALENAVLDTQDEFVDPSVAENILFNIHKAEAQENLNSNTIQPYGKLTMSAKAAAKAIKALMKKVGKKSWNDMVEKVENATGTELVLFHWESINTLIDYLSDSGDTVEDAITKFLVKHGFNKTLASYIAKAFVLIVL